MTVQPAYDADGLVLYQGDCLDVLPRLPAESVNTVITSPPFWGLRVYAGCPPSVWGGEPEDSFTHPHAKHEWLAENPAKQSYYKSKKRWQHLAAEAQESGIPIREVIPEAWGHPEVARADTCSLCGAWRGWYGLEPTPEMYVEHTITILRLLRRVLRKDGVIFWDIDDTRVNPDKGGYAKSRVTATDSLQASNLGANFAHAPNRMPVGIRPKNLALIPERMALAAQADGWIIRSIAVIPTWMPESAKDRPTDSYRRVIIMAKTGRYFWDAQALWLPAADPLSGGPGSPVRPLRRLGRPWMGRARGMTRPVLCAYCRSRPAVNADHVVPKALRKTLRAKYGALPEELRGTVPACFPCNVRKGTRKLVPPSWAAQIPVLKELIPGPWRVWSGSTDEDAYRLVYR